MTKLAPFQVHKTPIFFVTKLRPSLSVEDLREVGDVGLGVEEVVPELDEALLVALHCHHEQAAVHHRVAEPGGEEDLMSPVFQVI